MGGPKRFTVPKTFLTKTSEYFQACCRGPWKEAESKTVTLQDAEPDAFATYLQWLYTGEVVVSDELDEAVTPLSSYEERRDLATAAYLPLFELAVLADRLGDVTCGNAVADATIELLCQVAISPPCGAMQVVYRRLPQSAGLRRILVEWLATRANIQAVENKKATLLDCPELTFDVMIQALKISKGEKIEPPTLHTRCKYHEHTDKVPKCA